MSPRARRPPPEHLTAMGTSGFAGPGFTPDDVFDHAREGFRGHGPAGTVPSDARIHDDVCDELTDDPDLDARAIEVSVADGIVVLNGTVATRAMRTRAAQIADDVAGVKEVDNHLRVRRGPGSGR
jgi:osmotically-inducible protein OsmY